MRRRTDLFTGAVAAGRGSLSWVEHLVWQHASGLRLRLRQLGQARARQQVLRFGGHGSREAERQSSKVCSDVAQACSAGPPLQRGKATSRLKALASSCSEAKLT